MANFGAIVNTAARSGKIDARALQRLYLRLDHCSNTLVRKTRPMDATPAIDPELLEILRCPVAVQYKDKGDDPGKLELVHGCWLVSADSGYKYPIRKGIPIMLVSEGEQWKDTPVDQLPVPPPAE